MTSFTNYHTNNRVDTEPIARAENEQANADAATAGATSTHHGPGVKRKKARQVDLHEMMDMLFTLMGNSNS